MISERILAAVTPSNNGGPDILDMSTETHQIEAFQRPTSVKPHRDVTMSQARERRLADVEVRQIDDSTSEITLNDEIGGWGAYSAEIIPLIEAANGKGRKTILKLKSPGGDPFEAFAIATAMQLSESHIVVVIYGVAASAATLLVAAADEVQAYSHSQIMIHEPSAVAYGNADALIEAAGLLGSLKKTAAKMYADGSNGLTTVETAMEWMRSGVNTWMTALDAAAHGLIDLILDDKMVARQCASDADFLGELPEGVAELLASSEAPAAEEEPVEEVELIEPEVLAEPEFSAEAAAEIRIACSFMRTPERAEEFITARATLDHVREALWNSRVEASAQIKIDTRVSPRAEDAAEAAVKAKQTTKVQQAAEIRRRQIAALSPQAK